VSRRDTACASVPSAVGETRKLAAILVSDVVGYSRLAGADEDRILARLRALRSDMIDPTIAVHHGRVVKRTGDGSIVEFRSVVDAVRCAIEVQNAMVERNAGVAPDKRIEFRIGVHLGDVVEESDGDLMGDGVNIAARLEGIAEPGGICISNAAYEQVRDRVKEEFVDLGERQLKNIARRVRAYAIKFGSRASDHAPRPPLLETFGPPRLSIVVLPFTNLSGDAGQEYFVDGVTETLTTELSRRSGFLVIGRNTAFTYKGKAVDLKRIGAELNVRYALEGSVQRGGARVRMNVQLLDAETGTHIWAERFDKPDADLFDMQDEIVSRLTNTLNVRLLTANARRAQRAPHRESMDLFSQGMAAFFKGSAQDDLIEALGLFERALELDHANVDALVMSAAMNSMIALTFYPDDRIERLNLAEAACDQSAFRRSGPCRGPLLDGLYSHGLQPPFSRDRGRRTGAGARPNLRGRPRDDRMGQGHSRSRRRNRRSCSRSAAPQSRRCQSVCLDDMGGRRETLDRK
jgi:TolB-like protein/class 3 adenylate cyclase